MEAYLPISYLNDFVFCPRSIYFHQLYGRTSSRMYQTTSQIAGKAAHKTVDNKTYTTSKKVLQTISVYSSKYRIAGKIDTFDKDKQLLTERKKKIKTIYDGFIFQLYAQYHCLIEMGYQVENLKLYSMDDNKSYPVELPKDNIKMQIKFEELIRQIRSFDLNIEFKPNPNKCKYCVYKNLCDKSLV